MWERGLVWAAYKASRRHLIEQYAIIYRIEARDVLILPNALMSRT